MTQTHKQIIKDRGGPTAFAEAVSAVSAQPVQVKTVQMWVYRRKIPRERWPEVTAAFPDLTIEALKEAEPERRAA